MSGVGGAFGAGCDSFLDLVDTPADYSGQAGESVRVNPGETGLEFFTPGGGGVTDHGALTGLADDDHAQYLLLAGRAGGQVAYGGTGVAEELELFGSTDAGLGRVRVSSPLELDDVSAGDQVAFRYRPTFAQTAPYIGGMISSAMDVTFSNSVFIYALLAEGGTFRQAVAPGFAAFTLFNALPRIVNSGNFNLVQALVLNAGPQHERATSGTSTTTATVGMNFAPQARARASGATLTYTQGMTAVNCAPTFSTVGGSVVNFGTIRGLWMRNPAVGLFQTGGGTENMTACIGLDFDAMAFGGNVTKSVVRSSLAAASNARFLDNLGTAESDFGAGDVHLDDNTWLKMGNAVANPDIAFGWQSASSALLFSTFFSLGANPLLLRPTAADEWIFEQSSTGTLDIGMGFNVNAVVFGTTAPTPNSNNWFVQFAAPNQRQVQINGEYSDVLWTAGGSIDVNGLTVSDLQAFKINSPAVILNGGTISDMSNLYVAAMPSFGATRHQALRVLGRTRVDGLMCHNEATLSQLTADVAALALPPNNAGRFVLLQDADASGPWTIQGIVNVQVGDAVYIVNNGTNAFDFGHEDGAAAAADRIITPTAATWTLGPREFAKLWYDPVATRWRILESNGA